LGVVPEATGVHLPPLEPVPHLLDLHRLHVVLGNRPFRGLRWRSESTKHKLGGDKLILPLTANPTPLLD
jgi:hypothetical protein